MTRGTLDYLLRLALAHRDEAALVMIESGLPSPEWGEAAAVVKELLDMMTAKGGTIETKQVL